MDVNMTKSVKITILVIVMASFSMASAFGQSALAGPREVASGDSGGESFRVFKLVSGLRNPWALAFLPDGGMLISERSGRLLHFSGESGGSATIREIEGLPRISANGQGGLLDIVLHPEYERNGWIYFTYSSRYQLGDGTTLGRARLSGTTLVDVEELFRMSDSTMSGRHFGSRLVFAADGTLFMTIGDRGDRDRAQDLGDHAGSVLRLNDDGTVPADNPFADRSGALPEIYSYGHRNAQGMALNPATGEVWLHEHGPRGGDEINVVRPGRNFGWPVISYGAEYVSGRPVGEGTSRPGLEQPVLYWTPSIAPSGMTFYAGDAFAAWAGDIFAGALAGQHLRRVRLNGERVISEDILLENAVGRIRDVRTGPDGYLYIVTDESDGGLYRLEPAE
jgi:glucose/arabinose dehydrogenase